MTTVTSAVSGPAIQYQYVFSQSPDPSATDGKSLNKLTFIQDTLNFAKDAKGILNFVKDAKGVWTVGVNGVAILTAINSGITLLEFLGVLPKPPDEVAALTKEVTQIGLGITWQDLESYIDMNYGPIVNGALVQVPEYGTSYNDVGRPGDDAASIGLTNLYADSAWQRAAVGSGSDSSTDQALKLPLGPDSPYGGTDVWPNLDNWKEVIKAPPITGDDLVFEWRLGAPVVLKAIALRLTMMAAEDPNFATDHYFDAEIGMMRSNLLARYQTMLDGVQCGSLTFGYDSKTTNEQLQVGDGCAIVCADIYTGMSALSAITPTNPLDYTSATCANNKYSQAFADMMNYTAFTVRNRLPLFEMRSMIDSLYTLLHPGYYDLTQKFHRITPQSQQNLCVGTVGESGAWGTNLQLAACNPGDPSQYWTYNRTTGQITNPNLGVCIDERWGTSYGTDIGVWGCDTPHPDANNPSGPADEIDNLAQKWTFDPESGQLRDAFGVAMVWPINPLSQLPAEAGDLIITDVTAQGGGFLPPPLDDSNPTVNMTWHADGHTKGDGNLDDLPDIELLGAAWGNIPIAENVGGGNFYCDAWSLDDTDFVNYWATTPNVKVLAGDFDGDGKVDVALTGGSGWQSIPVALRTGSAFHVVNAWSSDTASFGLWAASPNERPVAGDFNGDGRTDVALTGVSGWWTIPVAFSNGDGSFHMTDQAVDTTFNSYANQPGARPVVGDFNGDGRSDIAIVGGTTSNAIPIALSNGDGNFTIKVETVTIGDTNFAYYATLPGVQAVSGDFDGDGKGDIALTGGAGWGSMPIAFSSNGSFRVTNAGVAWGDGGFPTYASWSGVIAVAGDFNNDGKSDIALTGGSGWWTIPVAYSIGDGTWGVTNISTQGLNFPGQAATPGVSAIGGAY